MEYANNHSIIKKLSNEQLIDFFEAIVRERHYNPSSVKYNQSDFSYEELKSELIERIQQHN